jgi:4-cresol dehydrogenase (hydroxylating) flavoprotein subunit
MTNFDILSDAFFADPYPTLAAMRSEAPCWYDPRLDAYVVTQYRDVGRVLKDEQFSSERVAQFGCGAPPHMQAKLDVCVRELERWLLFADPPAHTPLRRRLGRVFGPRLQPLIRRGVGPAVAEAVERLRASAAPDLVRDFAYPVPTTVLASLLGVPNDDIERFKGWTVDVFALIGAGIADEAAIETCYRGVTELHAYVVELLRDRRRRPRNDVLSELAAPAGGPDGANLDDDDIVGMFMTTIVAGHETTTNLISNALCGILSDRRARDWVLARGGIGEESVDELIRFDGAVFSLIRRARCDLPLAGKLIRGGQCVFAMLNAGNRDPQQFPDPDRLNFDRPRPPHLGLGVGLHSCIGAAMARTVVSASVSEFLRAWPEAEIGPERERKWQRNMSIRGLVELPVDLRRSALRGGLRGVAVKTLGRDEGLRLLAGGEAIEGPLPDLAENRPRRAASVVRANDVGTVRALVLAANERGVPLYPVSTGKNWGLGSRAPVLDGGVILDLGGMKGVRELDLERGVAVVEPGVTQGELADRLSGTPFMLNVTTSCRGTSVLANALEQGQGAIRLRVDELLGVEAVLGNGALVTAGGVGPADGRAFFGRGSGPDATRLFCQSNFGVVTAAAIALVPRPERTCYLYASYAGEALPAVVDRVGRLRREGVTDAIFYFSEMQIDPSGRALPDFTLLGPVLGRRRIAGEALDIAREELGGIPGCKGVRSGDVDELAPGDPLYHRGRTFLGIPACEPLRKRFGTTSCDLDGTSRNGWSVLQTLLPLDGRAVGDALAVLKAGVDAWGVPVQPHVSSVTARSINLMTMIWFERSPEGIERMRRLRDELQAKLVGRGYHPSREGVDVLRAAAGRGPRDEAWAHIKAALDPKGVIAPGRYVAAPTPAGRSASTDMPPASGERLRDDSAEGAAPSEAPLLFNYR